MAVILDVTTGGGVSECGSIVALVNALLAAAFRIPAC